MNRFLCAQKLTGALAAVLFTAALMAGSPSAHAGTSGTLRFSSKSYSVAQSAGAVTLTVNRTGGATGAASVQYSTQGGTATSGTNFTSESGTLQWASGDGSAKTLSVPITANGFSGTKMFHVVLGSATRASLGTPSNAVVSISGAGGGGTSGSSALSLSSSSYSVAQSAGSVAVTVQRSGSSSGTASVAYATSSGTAAAGTDFTSASGTLNWASGDASAKTFNVAISDATPFSGNKTFGVALSNASTGASVSTPGQATVTIAGGASSGGSGGSGAAPTNAMIIEQGTSAPNAATMFSCTGATSVCPGFSSPYTVYYGNNQSPNLNEIGWKGVSGATNYAIYRSTNGGTPTLLTTISAATASSNYSSYVSNQSGYGYVNNIDSAYTDNSATNVVSDMEYPPVNLTASVAAGSNVLTVGTVNNNASSGAAGVISAGQGIGGPGIPAGTTIGAFGSGGTTGTGGAGTYQLSKNATATAGSRTYGTEYFPNTSYTYYVEAEVGGAWSSPSAYATLPYVVNGQYILSGGVFGGPAAQAAAPTTTPLGNSNALEWTASAASSVIGIYAGNSAADQALNIGGYGYLNVAFYTSTPGINLGVQTEVPGDNVILPMTPLSNFGFGNLTANAWTTYKIPLSDIYIDKQWSGSGIQQNSLYKVIFQYDYGAVSSTAIFMEMWFSVN